jgi:hypothetical protein
LLYLHHSSLKLCITFYSRSSLRLRAGGAESGTLGVNIREAQEN